MMLLGERLWDEDRQCFTVAETEHYWVDIIPMIFNHRVVLSPKDCPQTYDFGWCYPDWLSAALAVMTWAPSSETDPPGFIKAVGPQRTLGDL